MNHLKKYLIKISLILVVVLLSGYDIKAQNKKEGFFRKHKFVNMTEFGGLFGRVKYQIYYGGWYPYPYPNNNPAQYQLKNKVNLSMQTFNGIYIDRKTAAGITIGVDGYGETVLMPLAMGVRRSILQKKDGGSSLQAGIDAGYATTWLNEDNTGYTTKGGLLVSPTLGYKLPMRNGSAWLINIGYRFQRAEYKQERNGNEVYWSESNEVRNYKRMVLRLGIEF